VSKILAGQEADKTNEMLQCLARAIEKSSGGDGVPVKVGKGSTDSKPSVKKPAVKAVATKSESQGKLAAATKDKPPNSQSTKQKVPEKPKGKGADTKSKPLTSSDKKDVKSQPQPASR
jgi:TRAF3-interacting protein 1